jgi:hypothetical protein
VDNWQAFVPPTGGTGDQLEPGTDGPPESVIGARPESAADERPVQPASLPPDAEERARTLSLIDFLADYDARKNPPVYDIGRYDLFLMRDGELPSVPGVNLSPAAQAWLTVDFLDLPPRPEVPDELVRLLGETADISPHARPEVRTTTEDAAPEEGVPEPGPALVLAAEDWIVAAWESFAARWAAGKRTMRCLTIRSSPSR